MKTSVDKLIEVAMRSGNQELVALSKEALSETSRNHRGRPKKELPDLSDSLLRFIVWDCLNDRRPNGIDGFFDDEPTVKTAPRKCWTNHAIAKFAGEQYGASYKTVGKLVTTVIKNIEQRDCPKPEVAFTLESQLQAASKHGKK